MNVYRHLRGHAEFATTKLIVVIESNVQSSVWPYYNALKDEPNVYLVRRTLKTTDGIVIGAGTDPRRKLDYWTEADSVLRSQSVFRWSKMFALTGSATAERDAIAEQERRRRGHSDGTGAGGLAAVTSAGQIATMAERASNMQQTAASALHVRDYVRVATDEALKHQLGVLRDQLHRFFRFDVWSRGEHRIFVTGRMNRSGQPQNTPDDAAMAFVMMCYMGRRIMARASMVTAPRDTAIPNDIDPIPEDFVPSLRLRCVDANPRDEPR
jgi:hypothetical protein